MLHSEDNQCVCTISETMVLGLRTKNRKGVLVKVDYIVHVQEIKPWPPSQSVRSVQSVVFQWENGDQASGFLSCSVGNGRIEFSESFRLPVALYKDGKSRGRDSFQKNCLEFNLYEPRKDKAGKGQVLGSAIINLADYGIIEEAIAISTPLNCKKSHRNMVQPVIFLKIQPVAKDSTSSSPVVSLSKEASLDQDGGESVSELMSEENNEEVEIASFTDDDGASSHSSRIISSSAFETTGCSPAQTEENGSGSAKDSLRRNNEEPAPSLGPAPVKPEANSVPEASKHLNWSSSLLSTGLLTKLESPVNDEVSFSDFSKKSSMSSPEETVTNHVQSSSSSFGFQGKNEESGKGTSFERKVIVRGKFADRSAKILSSTEESSRSNFIDNLATKVTPSGTKIQVGVSSNLVATVESQANGKDDEKSRRLNKNDQEEPTTVADLHVDLDEEEKEQQENGQGEQNLVKKKHSSENELVSKFTQDVTRKQVALRSNTLAFNKRVPEMQGSLVTNNKLKHVKSVQLSSERAKPFGLLDHSPLMEKEKEIDIQEDSHKDAKGFAASERKERINNFSDSKVEVESRIKMLEEELREAAAIEVGLYSVVAEHGSSTNKVHAPARRLSRFYLHACKARTQAKRASAARAAASGLVLASKACGNDVPRLTFWLSNSIVLRAIVSQAVAEMPLSAGPSTRSGGSRNRYNKEENIARESSDDWEDPQTFILVLEKIEGWIFSRIIESVWWQTLTPYMQSTAAKIIDGSRGSNSRKTYGRRHSLGDQEQGNFSIELWKRAFKDACERLCPTRAGGHECGCLPVLSRLVMEQLVSRLDVGMFNAILRESAEEMPTDPVSDPICDSKVLPIPAGKSSFGAGAQLKNAVGNWSRWLTDLFGIDDNDAPGDTNEFGDDKRLKCETSFKVFHLLNALSDLMMLPFEMLADRSTRKEVCPTFGVPIIRRVLDNFVPDEFCPDPIPEVIFETLDSEDSLEGAEESITSFPCIATPPVYSPPSAASFASIIGEVGSQSLQRSGSSLLRKSHISDDELDELDSPITSIIGDNSRGTPTSTKPSWLPKGKGGRDVVRYRLLREVWRDGE